MPFEFAGATVPIRSGIGEEFHREWGRLAGPGASWTGPERVAIAAAARGGSDAGIPAEAAAIAGLIYRDPAGLGRADVEGARSDLGDAPYVELAGVASRLSAVDFFHRALGLPPEPLPVPREGGPTGEVDDRARVGKGWVPMVGASSIVGALSMVPAEMAAQEQLHGPIYLTYEQMGDSAYRRGLNRMQMELIASRTSAVNECFY